MVHFLKSAVVFGNDIVEVYRYTPDNRDYSEPEIFATFTPHKPSAVHSFQVTENYALFFYPAMTYDTSLGCIMGHSFHVLDCMIYLEDEPSDVFIVNLKTGEVQEIQVKYDLKANWIKAFTLGHHFWFVNSN